MADTRPSPPPGYTLVPKDRAQNGPPKPPPGYTLVPRKTEDKPKKGTWVLRTSKENGDTDSGPVITVQSQRDNAPEKVSGKGVKSKRYGRQIVPYELPVKEGEIPRVGYREITPSGDIYDIGSAYKHLTPDAIDKRTGSQLEGAPGTTSAIPGQIARHVAQGITSLPGALLDLYGAGVPSYREELKKAKGFLESLPAATMQTIAALDPLSPFMAPLNYLEGRRTIADDIKEDLGESATEFARNEPLRTAAQLAGSVERGEYIPRAEREQYPEYLGSGFYPRPDVNFGERFGGTIAEFVTPGVGLKSAQLAGKAIEGAAPKVGKAITEALPRFLREGYPSRSIAVDAALGGGVSTGSEILPEEAQPYYNAALLGLIPGASMAGHGIANFLLSPSREKAAQHLSDIISAPGGKNVAVEELAQRPKSEYFGDVSPVTAKDLEKVDILPYDILSDRAKASLSPATAAIQGGELAETLASRQGALKDLAQIYSRKIRGGPRQAVESGDISKAALRADKGYLASRASEAGVAAPYKKAIGTPLQPDDAVSLKGYIEAAIDPKSGAFVPGFNRIVRQYKSEQLGDPKATLDFKSVNDVDKFLSYLDEAVPYQKASSLKDTKRTRSEKVTLSQAAKNIRGFFEKKDPRTGETLPPESQPYQEFLKAKEDYAPVAQESAVLRSRGLGRFAKPGAPQTIQNIVQDVYRTIEHPDDATYLVKNMAKDARRGGEERFANKVLSGKLDDAINNAYKRSSATGRTKDFEPNASQKIFDELYGDDRKAATTNALARESARSLGYSDKDAEKFVGGFQEFNDFLKTLSPAAIKASGDPTAQAARVTVLSGATNILSQLREKIGTDKFYRALNQMLVDKDGINKVIRLQGLKDRQKKTQQMISIINTINNYAQNPVEPFEP